MTTLTAEQQAALASWYVACHAAVKAAAAYAAEIAACPSSQIAHNTAQQAAACEDRVRELFFPDTPEGTKRIDLLDGWQLKFACAFKRTIDTRVALQLREPLAAQSVSLDALLRWDATLVTKEYRELTAEARTLFDACVTTTSGKAKLELVPPKVQP